eukprot:978174-Pyramimonas_sp.AAC.1
MGEIMLAFQTIFVDREDGSSGKTAAEQIVATVEDARYPQVVIYPEGNTCNGRAVCGFKMGAFTAGVPVQPVAIKYKNPSLDPSWCVPVSTERATTSLIADTSASCRHSKVTERDI